MQLQKVKLIAPSLYQEDLCVKFSEHCYKTNRAMYAAKGHSDRSKIINDIYIGKMGEFAVFNFAIENKRKTSPPDIQIYDTKYKSHDADLISNGKNIHVKTKILAGVGDVYWTFNPNDPIVSNPSDDDFVSLVSVQAELKEFYAYFVPAKNLLHIYEDARYGDIKNKFVFEEVLLSK